VCAWGPLSYWPEGWLRLDQLVELAEQAGEATLEAAELEAEMLAHVSATDGGVAAASQHQGITWAAEGLF
jgi:hypothetical protein